MQRLSLEEDVGYYGKDDERDTLLNDLQLNQRERSAVANEAVSVGWYLAAVLQKGDEPAEYNNTKQRPVGTDPCLLKFKMSVPCKRHEDVAQYE